MQDGLLMRGSRIVVHTSLRLSMLDKLHSGHQGITKCRQRARDFVWWPGLNKQLEALVQNCAKCCKDKVQYAEPLMTSTFPSQPWQKVATDLFMLRGTTYLLIVDYSDNGPQFSSSEFAKFADEYNFCTITSISKYPQSNGEVEGAVKTCKSLLKKAEDPYSALLAYCTTPLECGYSPAELLMNRRLCSDHTSHGSNTVIT